MNIRIYASTIFLIVVCLLGCQVSPSQTEQKQRRRENVPVEQRKWRNAPIRQNGVFRTRRFYEERCQAKLSRELADIGYTKNMRAYRRIIDVCVELEKRKDRR